MGGSFPFLFLLNISTELGISFSSSLSTDQVPWLHCLATQTFRRQFTLTPYWFGKGLTTPDNPKFFQGWERYCHLAFFRRGHCHFLLICSLNHFSHRETLVQHRTPCEDFLPLSLSPSHLLSSLYAFFRISSISHPLPYILAWERELGETFSEQQWQKSFLLTHKLPMACSAQEKNYKIILRW